MSTQTTLDAWLTKTERSEIGQSPSKNLAEPAPQASKIPGDFLDIFDDTISCIELDMKHDRSGNVIGWMEGEPKIDTWDGSIDNKIKTLEEHVSKKGWTF